MEFNISQEVSSPQKSSYLEKSSQKTGQFQKDKCDQIQMKRVND